MTEFTATKIAAKTYKGMDENRRMHGGSFRVWDDEARFAALAAIDLYKQGEEYEAELNDDDGLREDVVDELVEMIQDEMEWEYDPEGMAEGTNEFKPLNFTHVAIMWNSDLAYVAEAQTAAEALAAFRTGTSSEVTDEGLTYYQLTKYEADRIETIGEFNCLVRAADERQITG